MIVNVWLALRDDAHALIKTRLSWDEETQGVYSGPVTNRQARLFGLMADQRTVERLFRVDVDGPNDWTVWTLYFNESADVLQKIQDELDQLALDYPNHLRIVGAWHFDGRQVGTQFVRDIDGNITGVTDAPTYPLHARILELMPDDVDEFDVHTQPTAPSDVNLLQGQEERRFVS